MTTLRFLPILQKTRNVPIKGRLTKAEIGALVSASHHEPRSLLGYHEFDRSESTPLCMVRVLEPGAETVDVFWEDEPGTLHSLKRIHEAGLFEGSIPHRRPLVPYKLRIKYRDGHEAHQARHVFLFARAVGLRPVSVRRRPTLRAVSQVRRASCVCAMAWPGTHFAVWAPNAKRVSVVGSFNFWDGRKHAMQARGSSGVWELFVPGVEEGAEYKYEIRTQKGGLLLKSDPFGFFMQKRPETASIVANIEGYEWRDADWMRERATP